MWAPLPPLDLTSAQRLPTAGASAMVTYRIKSRDQCIDPLGTTLVETKEAALHDVRGIRRSNSSATECNTKSQGSSCRLACDKYRQERDHAQATTKTHVQIEELMLHVTCAHPMGKFMCCQRLKCGHISNLPVAEMWS